MSRGLMSNSVIQNDYTYSQEDYVSPYEQEKVDVLPYENDIHDLMESYGKRKEVLNDIDKGIRSLEAIDGLIASIEEYQTHGGFDYKAKLMLETTQSIVLKDVGMSIENQDNESVWSNSNSDAPVTYGSFGERLKQTAIKIWEWIKDAFKRLVKWILDFFRRVVNVNEKMKKDIKSLRSVIEKGPRDYNPSLTYDDTYPFIQAFSIDDVVQDPKTSPNPLVIRQSVPFLTKIIDRVEMFSDTMKARANLVDTNDPASIQKYNTEVTAAYLRVLAGKHGFGDIVSQFMTMDNSHKLRKMWHQIDGQYAWTPTLHGNKRICFFMSLVTLDPDMKSSKKLSDFAGGHSGMDIKIIDMPAKKTAKGFPEEYIPVLKEQLLGMLDRAETITKVVSDISALDKRINSNIDQFMKDIDKTFTDNMKVDGYNHLNGVAGSFGRVKSFYDVIVKGSSEISKYLLFEAKALTDLVTVVVNKNQPMPKPNH